MDVNINGPKVIWQFGEFVITESSVNGFIVVILVSLVCWWITRDLSVDNPSKKQLMAEKIILTLHGFVDDNMGEGWRSFAPYIGALFGFVGFSNLLSLTGLRSPTADLAVTLSLALITFVMIHKTKIKANGGFLGYLKSFTQPFAVMTPLNIVGDLATPVSMSFRLFGNMVAGLVISALLYGALAVGSTAFLNLIGATMISFPIFQVGVPAVLSLYFDIFTGLIQAYIFCVLTMVFVSSAAAED